MASCSCERPLLLGRVHGDTPPRCFLCTKPVAALLEAEGGPGLVDGRPVHVHEPSNGDDPTQAHNALLIDLFAQKGQGR
jgi:hypothetical protein